MLDRERVNELYAIMGEFQEIKYHQETLLEILTVLESAYDPESQGEGKFVADSVKYYLSALREDFGRAINKMDLFILREVHRIENEQAAAGEK